MHLNEIFNNVFSSGFLPTPLVVAVAVLVAVAYISKSFRNRGLPPGPTGLPFLGLWPFIDHKKCHLQLDALKKKYGEVFSFTCTGTLFINLGSSRAVREAHITKSDCFSQRTEKLNFRNQIYPGGNKTNSSYLFIFLRYSNMHKRT